MLYSYQASYAIAYVAAILVRIPQLLFPPCFCATVSQRFRPFGLVADLWAIRLYKDQQLQPSPSPFGENERIIALTGIKSKRKVGNFGTAQHTHTFNGWRPMLKLPDGNGDSALLLMQNLSTADERNLRCG